MLYHNFFEDKEVFKSFSLGAGYNATNEIRNIPNKGSRWIWISRYLCIANATIGLGKWELIETFMGEYQVPHTFVIYKHDVFRFRVRFNTPWKFTAHNINPFFSNEWFFRKNSYNVSTGTGQIGGWNQNRLRIGISSQFYNKVAATFYLQWRAIRHNSLSKRHWNNTFQTGMTLDFSY